MELNQNEHAEEGASQSQEIVKFLEKLTILKRNYLLNHHEVHNKDQKHFPSPQEENNEEEEDVKSISTDVSIYDIIGEFKMSKEFPEKPNKTFDTEQNQYLRKLMKIFKQFRSFIINQKVQLSLRFVQILIDLFVRNHLMQEEIHIVLRFFISLLDLKRKTHYFLEDGFCKLFFDFLLRLNYKQIDEVIYQTIETFIIFINQKLKIIQVNEERFELLQQNILGYEFIFDICIHSGDPKVKTLGTKFLIKIFKSQMTYRENFANCISLFYYNMIFENLFDFYNEFSIKNSRTEIKNTLEVVLSLIDEFECDKLKSKEKNLIDSLELQVIDQRINQNHNKRLIIEAFHQEKLKDLKKKIQKKFWINKENFRLLSKGKFLVGDENSLKDLQLSNKQTVMIIERTAEELEEEKTKKRNALEVLREMFPQCPEKVLLDAFDRKQGLEETIVYLTEEQPKVLEKMKEGESSEKNIFTERSFKQLFLNKLSSEEFFQLLFKLEAINEKEINFLIWKIINILPPNYILLQNIKKKIYQLTPQKIEDLRQTIESKSDAHQKEDYFDFEFLSLFANQHPIDCYKFKVFAHLVSISNLEQENSFEQSFQIICTFISHQGIKLYYHILSEALRALKKEKLCKFLVAIVPHLLNSLSGFIYAYFALKENDPFKEAKKLLGHKPWRDFLKLEESGADNNSSIHNVFLSRENQNFKGQKSPFTFVTPNFRSPADSKSVSGHSLLLPQRSIGDRDKEELSFSVFTNFSKDSSSLETMGHFLKKIIQDKEKSALIFKSFEESHVIPLLE